MEETTIIIAGLGGQGVQLLSKVLARAALADGHHVMLAAEYGGEMRGGRSFASVVIGGGPLRSLPVIERADLALQQSIGGDRRTVRETQHVARSRAGRVQDGVDAAHQADGGIGWCRGDLGDAHGAGLGIDRNDIGEGAAGVDADAEARFAFDHAGIIGRRSRPSPRPNGDTAIGISDSGSAGLGGRR